MHGLKSLGQAFLAIGLIAVLPLAGARAGTFTAQEQANMKLVADFYEANDTMAAAGDPTMIRDIAAKYIGEGYIQHMAAGKKYGNGRDNLIRMALDQPARPRPANSPPRPIQRAQVLALWAKDDLVIRVSGRGPTAEGATGPSNVIFNMFRVVNGKLVEHWDSSSAEAPGMSGGLPGDGPPGAPPAGAGPSGPAPSGKPN